MSDKRFSFIRTLPPDASSQLPAIPRHRRRLTGHGPAGGQLPGKAGQLGGTDGLAGGQLPGKAGQLAGPMACARLTTFPSPPPSRRHLMAA
jgi:hypothetical protein